MANNISFSASHSGGFPVIGILFLGEAHERLSNNGVPHLLVDVISANNARYCDKESTSSSHFLYRTIPKMAAEYAPILQEDSKEVCIAS